MRVLIATPLYPPQIGGPAKYAQELEREFARQGHEVSVLRFNLALPPGIRHIAYFARAFGVLGRADAALVLDTWSVGLPTVFAAQLRGKRAVVRIGGDFLWEAWTTRTGQAVKLSDFYMSRRGLSVKERIIRAGTRYLLNRSIPAFTTHWQRELWQRAYGFVPEKARVVENFYPEPGVPAPARAKVFVAAGRDIALKNKNHLDVAFAAAKRKHPDMTLDERPLPPEEHSRRIAECYAVVVASISEINPNTAIEAAAARKPFIAPIDCGGKDALEGMGLFVDTTDTASLERAIEDLLQPNAYEACIEASAQLRPRPWSTLAREYLALLTV